MIDLLQFQPTVNAKTAPCWVRLANLNHTVIMNEAEPNIGPTTRKVKFNRKYRFKDLTGMRFGMLVVLSMSEYIHVSKCGQSKKKMELCV